MTPACVCQVDTKLGSMVTAEGEGEKTQPLTPTSCPFFFLFLCDPLPSPATFPTSPGSAPCPLCLRNP